jgi:hypothetical protein
MIVNAEMDGNPDRHSEHVPSRYRRDHPYLRQPPYTRILAILLTENKEREREKTSGVSSS